MMTLGPLDSSFSMGEGERESLRLVEPDGLQARGEGDLPLVDIN
jgi:hypothetical protein